MGKSLVSCFFDSLCSSTCGVTIVGCIENESVPVQLAQCWFHALATSNIKIKIYFFRIEYAEAILSNSTRKRLRFEIDKMLNAV